MSHYKHTGCLKEQGAYRMCEISVNRSNRENVKTLDVSFQ